MLMKADEHFTVLLVCDSKLIGDRLADSLSKSERVEKLIQVLTVEDALRLTTFEKPGMIIVDIDSGKGIEVLRRIRQLEKTALVVAMSTATEPQYMRQSIKEGADYFFHLPSELNKMIELVDN